MARTLFLHCGPAKTGTSALQAHLRDNTRYPGLYYPQTGQWSDGAHHHIAFALKGMTARGVVPITPLETLKADLTREIEAATDQDILISSEGLTWRDTLPAFHETFAGVVSGFDRVVTLVVLRHPLERAASAYNQNLKDAAVSETRLPDDYLAKVGKGFALMPFVRKWRAAYPDVTFVNYHPARRLLPRLLGHLGQDYVAADPPPRRNASLGGRAALLLLLANRLDATASDRKALLDAMRTDPGFNLHQGRSHMFSPAATEAFLAACAPDLEAVKSALGFDLTGLYPAPPPCLALGPAQVQGIRRRIAPLARDDAQRAEVDAILASFAKT